MQGRSHEFLGGQVELLQSKADLMNAHAECAKHTQHANTRGSGGMPPPENFVASFEIESESILKDI